MTEAEWLACEDPVEMLWSVGERSSERKVRLFAVACCRRIWDLLFDPRCREAVLVAERYADGLAGAPELQAAAMAADPAVVETGDDCFIAPEQAAYNAACDATWPI